MFLPQAIRGNTRTYVLNGANSKATITLECDDFYSYNVNNQPIGRKWFILSSHYMELYTGQRAGEEVYAPNGKLANFSLVIQWTDITKNTDFSLIVYKKGIVVYNKDYNAANLPVLNQPITVIGDNLYVYFDTKNEPSKGLYMDFELLKGSSTFSVFISIFITLLSIYFV